MRTYLRLLAPLSILATALYLAFWASHRPNDSSMPLTAIDNRVESGTIQSSSKVALQPAKFSKN